MGTSKLVQIWGRLLYVAFCAMHIKRNGQEPGFTYQKNCSVEVSQHPFLHVNNQFFQVHKMELWFWVRPHSPALYPQLPPANSTAASWLIGPQLAVSTLSCLRGLGNHDKALVLSGSVICLMTGKLIVQSIHNWGTQVTNEGKWIVLLSRCWF